MTTAKTQFRKKRVQDDDLDYKAASRQLLGLFQVVNWSGRIKRATRGVMGVGEQGLSDHGQKKRIRLVCP